MAPNTRASQKPVDDFDAGEAGGQEVASAEWWKPGIGSEGEAIFGTVESFATGKIGNDETKSVTLAPAVIVRGGNGEIFGSMRVGLNSALQSRITSNHKGQHFAIKFNGFEKTPSGNMRTFTVHSLTVEAFRKLAEKYAPDLLNSDLPF